MGVAVNEPLHHRRPGHAHVHRAPAPGPGRVAYTLDTPNGSLTSPFIDFDGQGNGTYRLDAKYLVPGITHVRARAYPDSAAFEESPIFAWDQVVVDVPTNPVVSLFVASVPPVAGNPVRLSASLSRTASGPAPSSGTIAFEEAGQTLATAPVVAGQAAGSVGPLAAGPHTFTAIYSDPGGTVVASSSPVVVDVLAEAPRDTTVGAHGLAIAPTTFYPVKDGYLDTLTIKGVLDEAGTVSAAIYSVATGNKVRVLTLGLRTGTYSLKWDGRSSSGILQPAG
jgi:hypothetical protein